MSNFKFLLSEPGFASIADVAIAAEKILHIDPVEKEPQQTGNTNKPWCKLVLGEMVILMDKLDEFVLSNDTIM